LLLNRFIEKDGEWWAVAKDVADALGFRDATVATQKMADRYKGTAKYVPLAASKK